MSGEYGGCGKISQLNSDNFFVTLFATTCGLALSWWKIRAGNFYLEDEERFGRPPQTDKDKIRDLVEKSRSLTVQEMSNVLKIPKTTIHRCINDQV